jgi:glycosyltransferase involved in cell wall biosynthesis
MEYARAAFLPDTFHEINGVAHTSRQFEAFARRRNIPFLSIHCGPKREVSEAGAVRVVQLKRGPARFGLDANLDYDPFLLRYANAVLKEVKAFGADLVHATGPGDMGVIALYISWRLKIPLVLSWHTSLHEYAGTRLQRMLGCLGPHAARRAGALAENLGLGILKWYYKQGSIVLAPNQDLMQMISVLTAEPVFLMRRGVDTSLFSPARRNRMTNTFRLGYVGRLTAEKNVRFLAQLGNTLKTLGRESFEIMIVGEGRDEEWLRKNVPNAMFTGVLRGERLAEAYANMDLFVFPSITDTFGNVVLEALASGLPAVVTNSGGPKFIVRSGETGYVASSEWDFISFVNNLMTDSERQRAMREAARRYACLQSWDSIFEQVYQAYQHCLPTKLATGGKAAPLLSSRVHGRGGS